MLIKKNWSQFKEPRAPPTQSAPASDESPDQSGNDSSGFQDINDDDIEVLPQLNDEELPYNESDEELSELSDDQIRENFIEEKLKEKGIDIPLPFKKKSNTTAPISNPIIDPIINPIIDQNTKPVRKSRIIKPRGLTDFIPSIGGSSGLFSDSSSLIAVTVGMALVAATCLMKKNCTSNNPWRVY
jgi:hypothetical protein